MNALGKSLVFAYVTIAMGSGAQVANTSRPAPSAVNEKAPLTQPLDGTLFFGREQRLQMDRVRGRGTAFAVDGIDVEESRSVLNGFVRRSDGTMTVWIDDAYKLLIDSQMIAKIQSASVGMDSKLIMASEAKGEPKVSGQTRAKAPRKSRTTSRKPASGVGPLRK